MYYETSPISREVQELLEEVISKIEEEPRRLAMDLTVTTNMDDLRHSFMSRSREEEELPPCGTAGCIAGWAMLIHSAHQNPAQSMEWLESYQLSKTTHFLDAAAELLGTGSDWSRLFYQSSWPSVEDRLAYSIAENKGDLPGMMKATVKRIRQYMETGQ